MKKYISIAFVAIVLSLGFISCDVDTDEEPGGTKVEKMAGRWNVTLDVYDTDGNLLAEDPYHFGVFEIQTYNTIDNSPKLMWLDDLENFWKFKFKVDVDYNNRTFSADSVDYDADGTGQAVITYGEVLEGKAINLHGMPNDSIVFDIAFSDDDPAYGYVYRISGQRYTGFYE